MAISVQFTKIQRGGPGDLTEHGNKMTGIGATGSTGNILDLHIRFGQKELSGAADTVHCNILINRAAKEALKQTGEILRRNKNTLAQLGGCDVILVTGFDFFYYSELICLIKRIILDFGRGSAVHEIYKKIVTVRGKRFHIRCRLVVFSKGIGDQFTDI